MTEPYKYISSINNFDNSLECNKKGVEGKVEGESVALPRLTLKLVEASSFRCRSNRVDQSMKSYCSRP